MSYTVMVALRPDNASALGTDAIFSYLQPASCYNVEFRMGFVNHQVLTMQDGNSNVLSADHKNCPSLQSGLGTAYILVLTVVHKVTK